MSVLDTSPTEGFLAERCTASEYLLRPSHPDTAFELRGAARLAGKYRLDNVRSDMVKRVVMDWPTSADDWVTHQAQFQALKRTVDNQIRADREVNIIIRLADRTPEPVSAILFAQEHGCTEILPAAFYRLASTELEMEWGSEYLHDSYLKARWPLCDRDNLARWVKGRNALERYHPHFTTELITADMLDTRPQCRPLWADNVEDPRDVDVDIEEDVKKYPCFRFLWTLGKAMRDIKLLLHDPLTELADIESYVIDERVKKTSVGGSGLCEDCYEEFAKWLDGERTRLWVRLPDIFGLKSV